VRFVPVFAGFSGNCVTQYFCNPAAPLLGIVDTAFLGHLDCFEPLATVAIAAFFFDFWRLPSSGRSPIPLWTISLFYAIGWAVLGAGLVTLLSLFLVAVVPTALLLRNFKAAFPRRELWEPAALKVLSRANSHVVLGTVALRLSFTLLGKVSTHFGITASSANPPFLGFLD